MAKKLAGFAGIVSALVIEFGGIARQPQLAAVPGKAADGFSANNNLSGIVISLLFRRFSE